jgi:hypothetical protein
MTTNHGEQAPAAERMVVLLDLDKEFTAVLGEVEELLLTLRWQETGDPDDLVAHPAALGGGVALQALRRIADTVRPTQTDPDTASGGRLLGPDGRYDHVPLRFVRVRTADVDALSAAAAALREPVRTEVVSDALRLHAGHRTGSSPTPIPRWWYWSRGSPGCWTWNGPATPSCSAPGSANRSTPPATSCHRGRGDRLPAGRHRVQPDVDPRRPSGPLHLLTGVSVWRRRRDETTAAAYLAGGRPGRTGAAVRVA